MSQIFCQFGAFVSRCFLSPTKTFASEGPISLLISLQLIQGETVLVLLHYHFFTEEFQHEISSNLFFFVVLWENILSFILLLLNDCIRVVLVTTTPGHGLFRLLFKVVHVLAKRCLMRWYGELGQLIRSLVARGHLYG